MKSQIAKLKAWIPVPTDDDVVSGLETQFGFVTRTPLFVTHEYDNERVAVIPVMKYVNYVGMSPVEALTNGNTPLAIPSFSIMVPGMCGHFAHGGDVINICLN